MEMSVYNRQVTIIYIMIIEKIVIDNIVDNWFSLLTFF